jgi:hypothetical protein
MSAETRRERFEALVPALVDPVRRFLARRTDPATADDVLGPVLGLLTRLAVRRHGQSAVVAALSRAERAPGAINAF